MLWGSDGYSNPVQMDLEGWLLSIISFWLVFDRFHDYFWACFVKDKTQASMIIDRWNIKYLKSFFWIVVENLTMLCLCTLMHVCDGNHEDQNFDFSLTWVLC